jgi:Amt family ammonium transporter
MPAAVDGGTHDELLARVAALEARLERQENATEAIVFGDDQAWILLTATIVFLMQYGFALLESGMCRRGNVTATFTKNVLDACIGTMCALFFGYEYAFGRSPWECNVLSGQGLRESTKTCAGFFHHLVFQATAATIMSGAMAERTTISAYTILSGFVSAFPYTIAVRWTWGGGWLAQLGFHDFAGSTVVHVVGGAAAAAGVTVVGARDGRYDPHRFYEFLPHNASDVMAGALVLWVVRDDRPFVAQPLLLSSLTSPLSPSSIRDGTASTWGRSRRSRVQRARTSPPTPR